MDGDNKTLDANDAFSAALDGILSDPQMMSMISSLAQKLKSGDASSEQAEERTEGVPASASPTDSLSSLAPILTAMTSGGASKPEDNRACLLRALKPYLSQSRCDAIDKIISFSRISGVLKHLS